MGLREKAKKVTELSELMNGREALKTEDILDKTLTIDKVDMLEYEDARYPVMIFREFPNNFYGGGTVLKNIVDEWLEDNDDSIEKVNQELQEEAVAIKLTKVKSKKSNREYTKVEII